MRWLAWGSVGLAVFIAVNTLGARRDAKREVRPGDAEILRAFDKLSPKKQRELIRRLTQSRLRKVVNAILRRWW
jgi:hypothetical protein